MTKIIRRDPFYDVVNMRNSMDRLMDSYFGDSPLSLKGSSVLDLDMYQTENDVIIEASIPGAEPGDISISISGDILAIKGEVKDETETKQADYYLKERRFGSFNRSITLPTKVDADKAIAEFKNGVLTLTLPKAEEVKPKTITVKAR